MVQDLDTDKVTHIGNPHIINQLEKGGDFGELGLHDPHNKRQGTIITREKVNEFLVIDKVGRFALFVAFVISFSISHQNLGQVCLSFSPSILICIILGIFDVPLLFFHAFTLSCLHFLTTLDRLSSMRFWTLRFRRSTRPRIHFSRTTRLSSLSRRRYWMNAVVYLRSRTTGPML
jgi:hypothetical protein